MEKAGGNVANRRPVRESDILENRIHGIQWNRVKSNSLSKRSRLNEAVTFVYEAFPGQSTSPCRSNLYLYMTHSHRH